MLDISMTAFQKKGHPTDRFLLRQEGFPCMAIPESGLLWLRDATSTPWPHGMTTLNVRNELSCNGIWELTPIFLPNRRSHSSTKTHFVQVASAIFLLPELGTSSSNLYEVIMGTPCHWCVWPFSFVRHVVLSRKIQEANLSWSQVRMENDACIWNSSNR
jgi:hypothetical protein